MDFTDDSVDVPAPLEASAAPSDGRSLRSHALKGSDDVLVAPSVPTGASPAGSGSKSSRLDTLRGHHQIRAMSCEQNVIHRADGSARMSFGETVAIAAVYGPKQLKASRVEDTSAVVVSVSISSASHGAGTIVEREMEVILRDTVAAAIVATACPRNEVSVIIQVVHDAGSLLQCISAAVCLALMNAGIPLKYMFAALTCGCPGVPASVGDVWMDLTVAEEAQCGGVITTVYKSNVTDAGVATADSEGMLAMITAGNFTPDSLDVLLTVAAAGAGAVLEFFADHSRRHCSIKPV